MSETGEGPNRPESEVTNGLPEKLEVDLTPITIELNPKLWRSVANNFNEENAKAFESMGDEYHDSMFPGINEKLDRLVNSTHKAAEMTKKLDVVGLPTDIHEAEFILDVLDKNNKEKKPEDENAYTQESTKSNLVYVNFKEAYKDAVKKAEEEKGAEEKKASKNDSHFERLKKKVKKGLRK